MLSSLTMADKCAECGADGDIYIAGIPVCLACADARDARASVTDTSVLQALDAARNEYRLAMADIRTANELRQDLEVENLDGAVAGRKANDRFTAAQAAYHSAMDVFLKHAKRAGRMSSSNTSAKDSD